jgi:hypothetical protein
MRRISLVIAAAAALSLTTHTARAQQQFKVFASVADAAGNPVATLELTDLKIQEAGLDAKIVAVEPITWPTKLQVLVDNGVGLGGNFQILREALKGLLDVLPEGMEVTLVTTAPQPRFLVRATTDKKALTEGLGRLSPDDGTGRFVDSLAEAAQRVERDKSDHFPVIMTVGTTVGDTNVLERDVNRIFDRLKGRPVIVHVVLLTVTGGTASTLGANQTQVGLAVAKYTSGRYENIAAITRLTTLLPELGKQVAASHEKQSRQFRLTVERPAGAKGELDQIAAGVRNGLVLRGLSMDGRQP